MPQSSRTAAVIGLDGADFDIIGGLIRAGRMPNLRSLMQRGAWAKMRSVVPPVSSAAWTSMCSGVNPGMHGILGFAKTVEGTYRSDIIRASHVKFPQLWDVLGPLGKRSFVANLPNLYPPIDVSGVMLTGMLTPDANSAWCHPRELQRELAQEGLIFRARPPVRELRKMADAEATEALNEIARAQTETVKRIISTEAWDLVFCVLDTGDHVQHAYLGPAWHEAGPSGDLLDTRAGKVIAEHFAELDRLLGELVACLPDDASILVVSDHGFGPKPRVIYLNQWLERQGYLRRSRRVGSRDNATNWRKRRVAELLRKLKLGFVSRCLPERVRQREIAVPRLGRMVLSRTLNWSGTRAFLDPTALGVGIRINLAGREPQGIVAPGTEYETIRDELIHDLLEIREPGTDRQIVCGAWKREDIHPGNANSHEPDVVLELHEDFRAAYTYHRSMIRDAVPGQAAWHSPEGVLIAAGGGIRDEGQMQTVDIRDVAPTVYALLDAPEPPGVEGRPLPCLDPAIERRTQEDEPREAKQDTNDLTQDDDQVVTRRLRDLGYL